ncbi:C4-dicarboxylate ABC transporter permease [Hylemonella gracilis str. Niagara R]|uniref:TRAP transporter small permease protein n=1 Tax=Hylemonella gracilis str. Niagara R TaxID=1458275 RepID=A0A016XCW3_9BURK|nr:TRAP transporter small permease subunit [Hylemonella gracilis]EYC49750.1 C4-dicarboxylate ABC transporter permease [Hylemonella gracilis str. Niagara R]
MNANKARKGLMGLVGTIESVIDGVGRIVPWVALLMIGLVATNVVLRYLFSFGSVWAQELEWHLLAALILLGMSYALQRGDNVRVDLFYAGYTPRLKFVVDVLSVLLMLVVSLLFIKLSLNYVAQSWSINETSPDPGGIPWRWAVKSLIPLGYALVVLQSVGALLRLFLDRGKTAHEAADDLASETGKGGHV